NPEQELLVESVRKIVSRYGHDYYQRESSSDGRAQELWQELADNGFIGVNVPEEFGGAGLGITELMLVSEEVAAAGCPLLLMLVSPAICATIISRKGTQAQRQEFLPGLATGNKMAFAITEPNAGSNSHEIDTRAIRDGDAYRL